MAIRRLDLSAHNFTITEFFLRPDDPDRWLLDTPYQRGDVWDDDKRRGLVKSLLMGIPVGSVYVNRRPWNSDNPSVYGAVIDGKQRITAIRMFASGELAVPADWFATDTNPRTGEAEVFIDRTCGPITYQGEQVEGVTFDGLTRLGQGLFKRATIAVNEATVPTVEEEAEIYLLVNFGGVEQTDADRERAERVAGR